MLALLSLGLMLRSRAISAFTRVFDALWRGVSKHEAAPSFETRFALLRACEALGSRGAGLAALV